jgi:hypothetical protein
VLNVALFIVGLAGSLLVVTWAVLHHITVGSLRRAVRRGELDPTPGTQVRPVTLGALGVNPHAHYRYVPFAIPAGKAALFEGRAHPMNSYLSIVLYDRLLQSTLTSGPAFVVDPTVDPDGCFRLVLSREDPGIPGWLDISAHPDGVLMERHLGPRPPHPSRLRLVDASDLGAAWQ